MAESIKPYSVTISAITLAGLMIVALLGGVAIGFSYQPVHITPANEGVAYVVKGNHIYFMVGPKVQEVELP